MNRVLSKVIIIRDIGLLKLFITYDIEGLERTSKRYV